MLYYPVARSGRFDIDPIPLQIADIGDVVSLNLASFLTADAPSVVWSVVGGSLPPGLTLSAGGTISGTITGSGGGTIAMVEADAGALGVAAQAVAFSITAVGGPIVWAQLAGGTTQTWTEGAYDFQAQDFSTSATLTVFIGGRARTILVGGGAPGASVSSSAGGGGGGAGRYLVTEVWLAAGTYAVQIAASTNAGSNGAITSITPISAPGGPTLTSEGGGRGGTTSQNGFAGASGGGGGASPTVGGAGGVASDVSYGSIGGAGNGNATQANQNGGGGGGFSQVGFNAASGRGHGGGGIKVQLWGTLVFCGGGGAGSGNGGFGSGQGGSSVGGNGGGSNAGGVSAAANTGSGGGGAGGGPSGTRTGGAGASGRAIVWVEV